MFPRGTWFPAIYFTRYSNTGNPYFMMNYLPRGQADCPGVLRNLMPSAGGPPIDYTLHECTMCGLHDPRDGGICDNASHHDGCGRHLSVGDLVIPWGEDVRLVRGDTLGLVFGQLIAQKWP